METEENIQNTDPGDNSILVGEEGEQVLVIPDTERDVYEIWDNGEYDEVERNPE